MARLYTSGWESGSLNELTTGLTTTVTGDNMAVVTGPAVRSGNYALKVDYSTTASTGGRVTQVTVGGGATNTLFIRTYIYITSAVTERCAFIRTNSAASAVGTRGSISLNTDGSIQIYNGATAVGSASAPLSLNTHYRVELSSICNGTNQTVTLLLDGSTVASAQSFANTNADSTTVQLGWSATGTAGPTKAGTFYLDDFAVNYEGGTSQTTFPGDGKVLLLLPVADSAVGTGWTLGTGTATGGNAWAALDNTPPQGVADLTAGSDTKQVRNAASAANSALDLFVTDYATAGIATADTVTLVTILFSTGAPSATSAKSGSMQIVSNPAGVLTSIGTFYAGAVAATYPTGWISGGETGGITVYGDIASGSRATRPVIRVQQVTSSTRISLVDAVGLYVEYVAAAAPTAAPKPILVMSQAVNRAFSY